MNKKIFLYALMLCVLLSSVNAIQLLKINATGDQSVAIGVNGITTKLWGAQTFNLSVAAGIQYVEFNAQVTTNYPTCFAQIYSTNSTGYPIGNQISNSSEITCNTVGIKNFTFNTNPTLNANTAYAIVINTTTPPAGTQLTYFKSGGGASNYTKGKYLIKTNDSGNWQLGGLDYSLNMSMYGDTGTQGIYINVFNYYTGANIFPVTATLSNGTTITNNTGNFIYFNASNGNYSVTINASGYIENITNFELINSSFLNIYLLLDNRLQVNFVFEENLSVVTNNSFNLICNNTSGNYSTFNGSVNLIGVAPGVCEVRYTGAQAYAGLFNDRSYFFIVPLLDNNFGNVTLKQIYANASSIYQRTVYNQNAQPLEGYYLDVQRFYVASNSWQTVEIAKIDSNGNAIFHAVPNTVAYRFRILDANLNVIATRIPSYLTSQTENFYINIQSNPFNYLITCFNTITIIRNTSNSIVFDYAGSSSVVEGCLYTSRNYRFQTFYNSTCLNASSGTLVLPFDSSLNGTWQAYATLRVGDNVCTSDNYSPIIDKYNAKSTFGLTGVFIYIIGIIIAGSLSFVNPIIGISAAVLWTFIASSAIFGFLSIAMTTAGGILILGIIVLYLHQKGGL